jgi:amicoumacin kinase
MATENAQNGFAHLDIASFAAQLFFPGTPRVEFVQESEHPVYSISGGRHFLRLTSSRRRSIEEIHGELDFVRYLHESGLSVSKPIPSKSGHWIEILDDRDCQRFCTVFEAAPGRPAVAFSEEWNEDLFNRWGRTLGKLHTLSASYTGSARWEWHEDPLWSGTEPAHARTEYEIIRAALDGLSKDSLGLIHGDFGRQNFHVDDGTLTVFDFDDCCRHYFAYDVATSLWPLRGQTPEARETYLNWMLAGYRMEASLDDEFIAILPWMFRLRNLYMYLYNLRLWGANTDESGQRAWLDRVSNSVGQPIW